MQTCLQHSCQPIHCRVTGRNSFTGRKLSQPAIRPCRSRQPQRCRAGLLWQPDEEDLPTVPEPKIVAPANAYGLSPRQIQALGLANDWRPQTTEAQEEEMWKAISATTSYASDPVCEANRMVTRMAGWQPATGSNKSQGSRKPPDLPSLLLDARIVYVGMPLVPSVAELLISELLWLNWSEPEKPAYIYFNSIGSQSENGEAVAFDTDAYTILDTMRYIRPDIYTINVGKAYGNAAMLLASGEKGKRMSVANGTIQTAAPRMNRSFGNVSNMMIKANELEYTTKVYIDLMCEFTGKDQETMKKDMGRNRWFTPTEAIDYGIIDRVVEAQDTKLVDRKDYSAPAQQRMVEPRAGGRVPAGASADAGL